MKKLLNSFKTRSFRIGGYSVIATVVLVAIVVLLNVLVSALPARYTEMDLTPDNLYTLSPESRLIARRIDKDVTIYWIVQSGKEDATVENLINRYLGENSRITMKKIDPDVQPTFTDQYGVRILYNNSLILESGDLYRYVIYTDIFKTVYDEEKTDPATGEPLSTTVFDGENAITRALNYVANGSAPTIYSLKTHGEEDLPAEYTDGLKNQNITVKDLDLLQEGEVPEDCNALLIAGPEKDISEEERELILQYLKRDGSLFLVTTAGQGERPNLDAIGAAYGLEEQNGIIVEGNTGYYASKNPAYFLLPRIETHQITNSLASNGYYVFMPASSGLLLTSDENSGISTFGLLMTSGQAYLKDAIGSTYEKEEGDIQGPFAVGAIAEKANLSGGSGKVVWFTSDAIISETANEMVAGGNLEVFVNAVAYLCDQKDTITIHSKNILSQYLTITGTQSTVWSIVLIGVLPLIFVVIGIAVVTRRRKR